MRCACVTSLWWWNCSVWCYRRGVRIIEADNGTVIVVQVRDYLYLSIFHVSLVLYNTHLAFLAISGKRTEKKKHRLGRLNVNPRSPDRFLDIGLNEELRYTT